MKYRPKNPPGIIFRVSRHMDYMAVVHVPRIDAGFSVLVYGNFLAAKSHLNLNTLTGLVQSHILEPFVSQKRLEPM